MIKVKKYKTKIKIKNNKKQIYFLKQEKYSLSLSVYSSTQ